MRGWETPPALLAAMREPIGPDTPLAVLEALRDDAAVRAEIFPDAELARQALEALIDFRGFHRRPQPPAASSDEAKSDAPDGVVVDDRDDCLGCQ